MQAEEGVLELATLGRPMQLGMLYDCRKDSILPGLTLWDPAVLQNDRDVRPQPGTQFEILASDRIDDKMTSLKVGPSLKASFYGGLVEVQGSAKFLKDKRPSNRQTRLTLHYKTTSRFEQLTMKQLGRHNVQHPDIFDQRTATHVVTGVLYGAQGFFVFYRDCTSEENIKDVQAQLHIMVKMVESFGIGLGGSRGSGKRQSVDEIRCKFHGDFNLESNPSTYEEALSVYKKLPSMLGSNGENAVPMQVWLYPLHKLDHRAAKLVRQISVNLISKSQGILEGLEDVEVKCNDMIMSDICEDFPQFKDKLCALKRLIFEYELPFQKELAQALPAIRGGGVEEIALADTLRVSEQSPFGLQQLNDWVACKEDEMNVVKEYMKLFAGIKVIRSRADLVGCVHNPMVKNLICLSFPLAWSEEYLKNLSEYLKSPDGPPPVTSKPTRWFDDKSTSKNIRSRARNVAEFYRANADAGNAESVFTVTGLGVDDKPASGCSVLLYEEGVLKTKLFEPPSRPGKPSVSSKSHDEVTLEWLPPKCGLSEVKHYHVQYMKTKQGPQSRSSVWQKAHTSSDEKSFTIRNLQPFTSYEFRVAAVCRAGVSQVSENSGACTTLPAGPPTRVREYGVSESSLTVVWDHPASLGEGVRIQHYRIRYKQLTGSSTTNPDETVKKTTGDQSCQFTINNLQAKERYVMWVTAVCGSAGNGSESDSIEINTDQVDKPAEYAKKITENAEVLAKGCKSKGTPTIFKVPLIQKYVASDGKYRSFFSFGEKSGIIGYHKVIMLVGVTGAGKSTLINKMINYIFQVDWKAGFRFKIVDQQGEGTLSQEHSQTQNVSSYTIYRNKHHNIPYTLTIIDTPGFANTRGIERDKAIVDQMRDFFSHSETHKVDHIDAICFVIQSSSPRLTRIQRYVFDSILSVFGKDISPNILLLVTFCDGQKPPVIKAVKAADIPCSDSTFEFNNSALFASTEATSVGSAGRGESYSDTDDDMTDNFDKMFWRMGMQSMYNFFSALDSLESRSLSLTKEVLEERKRLETAVEGLQPQICMGLCKLEELRIEQQILEHHETEIKANKSFTYEVKVPKLKKIHIPDYIMNCSKCHYTCHYPCEINEDTKKYKCKAMDGNGCCRICPGKCTWDVHFSQNYETRHYGELEERYKEAMGKKLAVEQVIKKLKDEFLAVQKCVFVLITESHHSLKRLEEITLKPNPLISTVEYADLLIESERTEAKPGWKSRILALEVVKKQADIMAKVKQANFDPFANYKK